MNPKSKTSAFHLVSKCNENLLWSAPEFVYKVFLESPGVKNLEDEHFIFKLEHVFQKNIDRGITVQVLDKILGNFLRKYPSVVLDSLHVKVCSWLNLNDFALNSMLKMLTVYGPSLKDLQLFFSG